MIEPDVLRKAQLIMLDMLVEFDAICKKHHLRYWLDSGTLLGAVRHHGFIPWDDDIDLSMPVEDYHEFLKIAEGELSGDIFLQNRQTDKHFRFDYTKLRSNRATIIEFHEQGRKVEYHQGVFIDIFPMLTLESSEANKELYEKTFEQIRGLSAVSLHTLNGTDDPEGRGELVASLRQRHQGWSAGTLKVIYGGEMPDVAAWFDIDEVLPLSQLEFEGLSFPVPKSPTHYLGAIYSFDFMELPPEEKRLIHAHSIEFTRN